MMALPNGWKEVKIKEISNKVTDGTHKTPKYAKEGVPFISTTNLVPHKGDFDFSKYKKYITKEKHKELIKRCNPEKGDILISKCGTIGRTQLINVDYPFSVFVGLALIKLKKEIILGKYIEYFLENSKKKLEKVAPGSTRKTLTIRAIGNFKIICPESLEEQQLIVDEIEKELTRLDDAIEGIKLVKKKLEIYRKAILKKYFDMEDSKKISISEVNSFIGSGITPKGGKSNYLTEGVPFIRSQNVYPFKFVEKGLVYVNKELHENMKRTHTKSKDILLNITGASIGRCAIIPEHIEEANVNQHVCIIRPNNEIIPEFLCGSLNSPQGQSQIMSFQGGVTRQGLNYQQLKRIKIPKLDIKTQQKIVQEIESKFSVIDKVEEVVNNSLKKSEQLRKSILKKAFEGELIKPMEIKIKK